MPRRKGISPVIATVIIVAVTIAVAIAVAFWMTGIIGLFTGFEQLQITSIWDDNEGIHLTVKNTGTSSVSITDITINGFSAVNVLKNSVGINSSSSKGGLPIPLKPGNTTTIKITFNSSITQYFNVEPGVSLEIKLISASGKEYPKLIVIQQYKPKEAGGT